MGWWAGGPWAGGRGPVAGGRWPGRWAGAGAGKQKMHIMPTFDGKLDDDAEDAEDHF